MVRQGMRRGHLKGDDLMAVSCLPPPQLLKAMKRTIITLLLAAVSAAAFAQSTNPLNYSGKMFVSSYEVLSTPLYVSYEDHAILSSDVTIPVTEVTTLISDFEKGILKSGEAEHKIRVTGAKKYTLTDESWVVVIFITTLDGKFRFEYVWREYDHPYINSIIRKNDGSMKIVRMNLSFRPQANSPDEALIQMLNSYGAY